MTPEPMRTLRTRKRNRRWSEFGNLPLHLLLLLLLHLLLHLPLHASIFTFEIESEVCPLGSLVYCTVCSLLRSSHGRNCFLKRHEFVVQGRIGGGNGLRHRNVLLRMKFRSLFCLERTTLFHLTRSFDLLFQAAEFERCLSGFARRTLFSLKTLFSDFMKVCVSMPFYSVLIFSSFRMCVCVSLFVVPRFSLRKCSDQWWGRSR